MIKLFYITGDSFAFGQELGTEPNNLYEFTSHKRKHCYSGIISDSLQITDYQNAGCPGGSNERAYRYLVSDVTKHLTVYRPDEIFVNISLTHAARREFCKSAEGLYYIHLNSWEPRGNGYDNDLWKILSTKYDYDHGHYTFDNMMILGMQNFLRINKIPYLFTSSMAHEFELKIKEKYVSQFSDQIYKHRFLETPSFNSFTRALNFPYGPGAHPLEEGHQAWAEYLLEYIKTNNLLDNSDLI